MKSDDDKPLTPQQAREKLQKGLGDYLAGNDPGPIVFRLKRTKKASETYPLKLTQHQRETLLNYTQLSRTLERILYQFRITLLDIKPAIWRRIQVLDCTLAELHEHIQATLGWWDCHLHRFEIDGVRYSQHAPDGDDFDLEFEDETRVLLSSLVPKSAKRTRWLYEYDFGDGWRHEVLFEGCPPLDPKEKYPLCLEGERACPPEDCGGAWGYVDYLAAIADPHHEQHEEMLEWRGPFDSEAFDPIKATRKMRKGEP